MGPVSEVPDTSKEEGVVAQVRTTRPATPVDQIPPKDFSPSHHFLSRQDELNPVTSRTTFEKVVFLLSVSLPAFAVPFASTAYAPLVSRLMEEYHVSKVVYQLTISVSVLGFGLAPVLFAPLTEVCGRKPVLVTGAMIFTAFNIGSIFAPNIWGLVILRFFGFLFGGAAVTLCIASLTDLTTYEERHIYYSIAGTFLFAGAAMGALVAGLIEGNAPENLKDWSRWICPIISFLTILPYTFFCTESYAPVIAQRRSNKTGIVALAHRRNFLTGTSESSSTTAVDRVPSSKIGKMLLDLSERYKRAITLPFLFATREPLIICVTLYVSLVYFFLYCTLEAFPYTFGQQRGWTVSQVSLTYISLLLGFLVSTVIPLCTTQQWYISRLASKLSPGEKVRPEDRLSDMLWCGFLAPVGLFVFAWTAPYPHVHWVAPMIGMFLFSFSVNVAFTDFLPYLADIYGPAAATALSVPAISRCLLASAAPLVSDYMFDGMTVQGSLTMLASMFLVLAAVPYLFWYKGAELRERSHYAKR